jgi:L-glyceraldehyde 3-phosphate reductase
MFVRTIEGEVIESVKRAGAGVAAFSPLAQGLLSDRYASGIPGDSRVASKSRFLSEKDLESGKMDKVSRLNALASERGQKLAQMAIAWLLKDETVSTVIIGASSPEQIAENAAAAGNLSFSDEEIAAIEAILND